VYVWKGRQIVTLKELSATTKLREKKYDLSSKCLLFSETCKGIFSTSLFQTMHTLSTFEMEEFNDTMFY
jgi:hypothetical protein